MASSPRVTYFERDFDFETHAAEVEKSWDPERGGGPAPARAVVAGGGGEDLVVVTDDDHDHDDDAIEGGDDLSSRAASNDAASGARPANHAGAYDVFAQADRWDAFHSAHDAGAFFKERRYLLEAFSTPLRRGGSVVACEVGCGSGSAALPLLRGCEDAFVFACDFSAAAVRCAERAVKAADDADADGGRAARIGNRFRAFRCDPSSASLLDAVQKALVAGGPVAEPCPPALSLHAWKMGLPILDVVLLVFVLRRVPYAGSRIVVVTGASLRPPLAFNPRHTSTPFNSASDAFQLRPDVRSCGPSTLSAVPPGDASATFLKSVFAALAPGGVVCFRDYGIYDHAMLRFSPSQRTEERTYVRGDGTLARFFTVEEARDAFGAAGFVEVGGGEGAEATDQDPLRYCCVHNENKRKGIKMRRVFVHGTWMRPMDS